MTSVREHGVLQPITAQRCPDTAEVTVLDGQLRTLAARAAGLHTIPVYVHTAVTQNAKVQRAARIPTRSSPTISAAPSPTPSGPAVSAYTRDRAQGVDALLICGTWEMADASNRRLHDMLTVEGLRCGVRVTSRRGWAT